MEADENNTANSNTVEDSTHLRAENLLFVIFKIKFSYFCFLNICGRSYLKISSDNAGKID